MSYGALSKNFVTTKPKREKRILLIDDQVEFLVPLNLILANLGISATLVFDGFAARRALRDRNFDLVVIDWRMPDLNGGECLSFADTTLYLQGKKREIIPFVTYSGLEEEELVKPDMSYFYHIGHWKKPMTISELTQRLISILDRLE